MKFSVGATLGLPIGDAKTYSNLVYGGDIQGEYAAAETVGLTLSAGYNSFSIKGGFGLTVTAIPVLVGYNVSENFDLAVKYQAISKNGTTAYIGLRAAYSF